MSHHYLDVRDLRYAYPDGTEALKGASFDGVNPRSDLAIAFSIA